MKRFIIWACLVPVISAILIGCGEDQASSQSQSTPVAPTMKHLYDIDPYVEVDEDVVTGNLVYYRHGASPTISVVPRSQIVTDQFFNLQKYGYVHP
jgi:hypothetical protein